MRDRLCGLKRFQRASLCLAEKLSSGCPWRVAVPKVQGFVSTYFSRSSLILGLVVLSLPIETSLPAQVPSSEWNRHPGPTKAKQAAALRRQGNYEGALETYQALLSHPDIREDPERHAYVLCQIADSEIELGSLAEAEIQAREAMSILAQAQKTRSPEFAAAERLLADVFQMQGHYGKAQSLAEQALALGQETLNPTSPSFAFLLTSLGQILMDRGDLPAALRLCRRAVQNFKAAGPENAMDLGTAYLNVAVIETLQGKAQKALQTANLALDAWGSTLALDHPLKICAFSLQIGAYTKMKSFAQAEALLPRVLSAAHGGGRLNDQPRMTLLNNIAQHLCSGSTISSSRAPVKRSR